MERSGLFGVTSSATWGHSDVPALVAIEFQAMQWQGLKSVDSNTIRKHGVSPAWSSHQGMWMFRGCVDLVPLLTGYGSGERATPLICSSTWEGRPCTSPRQHMEGP